MQGRLQKAGPSAGCKAVCRMQGRLLNFTIRCFHCRGTEDQCGSAFRGVSCEGPWTRFRQQISWCLRGKSWQMASGPPPSRDEEEPSRSKHGWQRLGRYFLGQQNFGARDPNVVSVRPSTSAVQAGPLAAEPFVCVPTSRLTRSDCSLLDSSGLPLWPLA